MQSDCPGGGAEAKTLNTQHRMGVNMPSQARSPRSPHWGVTMTMAMMAYLGSTTTRRNRKNSNGGAKLLLPYVVFDVNKAIELNFKFINDAAFV